MNALATAVVLMITAALMAQVWLYVREIRFQSERRDQLSQNPAGSKQQAQETTEIDFTVSNMRLSAVVVAVNGLILAAMTLGGGLSTIHAFWTEAVSQGTAAQVLTVVTAVAISALMHRLLAAYRQFSIFRRFKIGKMSLTLFAKDTFTNGAILLLVTSLLATVSVLGMAAFESGRWLLVWLIWICFDWSRLWLYSGSLAHMFDRLTILTDNALTQRIDALMKQSGCTIDKIEVIDSSKRSTHANARVVGIGNTKRIIFNDTLLATLTDAEIVAVMAHELGHIHHSHVVKDLGLQSAIALVWIVGAGHLLQIPAVQTGLNIAQASDGMLLALLWLLTPAFAIVAKPLISQTRRTYEFEADNFVRNHDDPLALQSALNKLHKRNATARVSDPLFNFVYHTHPSLQERLDRLDPAEQLDLRSPGPQPTRS